MSDNPGLGRFLRVDPLAHMYSGWSPYNYVKGNPILHTDPTGRSVDGEYERDEDGNWQKVSKVGDDIGVDFYHEDATASSPQTTSLLIVKVTGTR